MIEAGIRIGKRALKNQVMVALAGFAFVAIFFFNLPFPLIVFGAALIGFIGGWAGIPAFQFLVERLEYNSRTHHSNMDTFDRIQRDDMIQQATVIAVFAYDAAMRDEKLPRKALPTPQRGRGSSSPSQQP